MLNIIAPELSGFSAALAAAQINRRSGSGPRLSLLMSRVLLDALENVRISFLLPGR